MKNVVNTGVKVITNHIKKTYTHKGADVLTVDIEYPYIYFPRKLSVQMKINTQFRNIANKFNSYAVTSLKPIAIEQYEYSIKQGYPFHPYEAIMNYTITLNDNCTLSTYYNQYEYTGGAHGMTYRTSDTFALQTGNEINLDAFFINVENYKELILKEIIQQAEENYTKDPGIYFPDYKKLIVETFREESFFLTEDYFNFYFQQYDIAPYAAGIIVFNIPYKDLGITKPHCKPYKSRGYHTYKFV